jgi:hypothetical protein
MTPDLAAAVDVARTLAWLPWSNSSGRKGWYAERRDAHAELLRRLDSVIAPTTAIPELAALVAAIRRAAQCTYSNRFGPPYAERRDAIRKLRGALSAWDEEVRFAERVRAA